MKKYGRLATLAFAVAFAFALFGVATPALAAGGDVPQVKKTLQMNAGSTVSATFSYTITPKALSTGNGAEQTYTDGPTAAIADVALTNATSSANNTGKGAITFGGKTDASAFSHAGVYAWTIKENSGTYTGNGEMQYDTHVYTLIATVSNGTSGLEFSSIVVVDGDATSVNNANKVSTADNTIPFTNTYTENTNDQPDNPNPDTPDNPDNPGKANTNLVIKKSVTGSQGDKSKQFTFTVTFHAPSVLPNGKSAADVLNAIKPVANNATIVTQDTTTGDTRTITFTAADAQGVTFANLLVGTTYDISETAEAGYTQTFAAVANGANTSDTSTVLVGEKTNTATMTNEHSDVTPTGLVINNLPFILMGVVAIAGVVLYGAAKRRLER